MKKLLLLIFLVSGSLFSQTVTERFETFVCDCFTEKEAEFNAGKNLDLLDPCFDFPMEDYEEELRALVIQSTDTTKVSMYEAEYQYGKKMFSDLQTTLVNSCDPYYRVMVTTSNIMLENMKDGVGQAKIDSLSTMIKESPALYNLVWERGACHMAMEDYTKAISDFELCLENQPDFPPALFFLGWTHDLNDDAEKAMSYYQKVLDLDSDLMGFSDVTRIKMAIIERNAKK